jgi:iron(II)-dependent oxidoreductase
MALKLFSRKKRAEAAVQPAVAPADAYEAAPRIPPPEGDLACAAFYGRYGHIVDNAAFRKQPSYNAVFQEALGAIDVKFGLVPEGFVSIPKSINDGPGCEEDDVDTNPYLLARCAVSNAEFQMFVDSGGYEMLDLWPEDVWAHIIGFTDLTGNSGPCFWRSGRHDHRRAEHPVVGISFHEAAAYCRWAGYRLPTEAEWQMAATWRIRSVDNSARRYPWGDGLEIEFCNIWSSGIAGTVPVTSHEGGAAPNGVVQLIGNTWEWVDDDFECCDEEGNDIVGETLLKCIRGGAYDTYLPCAMDLPTGEVGE